MINIKKAIITGGKFLSGEVKINGAKNSILAIIPACLLVDGKIVIENICDILDVTNYLKILDILKIKYEHNKDNITVYSKRIRRTKIYSELIQTFRASYYLMGSLIGRYKKIKINMPGGCKIGLRPIDFHLEAFKKLGCKYKIKNDKLMIKAKKINGAIIDFNKKSVGATINTILASVYCKGITIIKNASLEPEVNDLVTFLITLGFNIIKIDDTIIIKGLKKVLKVDVSFKVMPDRIEALSYMLLGLMNGDLKILNTEFNHIENCYKYFKNLGCNINYENSVLYVKKSIIDGFEYESNEYPGLPTDILQIVGSYMMLCKGKSIVKENIFENRYDSFIELNKLNGNNKIVDNQVEIIGVDTLYGANLKAKDLRGCVSLVFAGLCANGVTVVDGYEYLERGYHNFLEKITKIGGNITIREMK